MVTVYITELTARVDYAFRLIFETILKGEVAFTTDKSKFQEIETAKINYSEENDLGGLYLKPYGLLQENHIQVQYPEIIDWDGEKAFYAVNDSFIPFDMFAASFFLVTRYEEYLSGKRDSFNRFMARHSCAGMNGFLEKPQVNIWALKLAGLLEDKYSDLKFERRKFKYSPTIDIDNAWAFKNKGIIRFLSSALKDVVNGRFKQLQKRIMVVTRAEKDPYDSYDYMESVFKKYNFIPTFFILLNKKGKRDRSLSHRNLHYRALILRLGKMGELGLHPSFESNRSEKQLAKEISRYQDITQKKVKRSRQHFLKMSMPTTYRRLIKHGVRADYSMCFPSRPGFRASIAVPHMWYDLTKNKATNLKIHPFQVMDTTLLHYRGMRTSDAVKKIIQLMDETARVGGRFYSLWHNESLGNSGRWDGWREVYEQMTIHAAMLRDGKKDRNTEE